MTEDKMVRWHHQLNGLESIEQALGDGEGQGKLHRVTVHGAAKGWTQLSG